MNKIKNTFSQFRISHILAALFSLYAVLALFSGKGEYAIFSIFAAWTTLMLDKILEKLN